MLDQNEVINTARQYTDLVTKEFAPNAVILYGSYANGTAKENSDIDIAVIFNGFNGDWLKTSARLWRLRRDISFDIEPVLLDSTQDKSGFARYIMETGQVIYKA